MNNESYYLNKINGIESEITNIEKELQQSRNDLNNLYEFQVKHKQMSDKFSEQIGEKKYRYANTTIKAQEVKFFAQQSEYMLSMLNGSQSQKILAQKENEKYAITKKIGEIDQHIDDLKRRLNELEQNLSNYRHLLWRERTNYE